MDDGLTHDYNLTLHIDADNEEHTDSIADEIYEIIINKLRSYNLDGNFGVSCRDRTINVDRVGVRYHESIPE